MYYSFRFLWVLLLFPYVVFAERYYVDGAAPDGGDGTSWDTAFRHLQDALELTEAGRGDEVWVAAGIYHPDRGDEVSLGDREASFQVKEGVTLYGGFTGVESELNERDWEENRTILSGEIGENVEAWSYHVCHVHNGTLDGIEVTRGNADGQGDRRFSGAVVVDGAITAVNCSFIENAADYGGVSSGGEWTVVSSRFYGNTAYIEGGVASLGTWEVVDSEFSGNSAGRHGGVAIAGDWSVTNSSFEGNTTGQNGGVARRGTWDVVDSTFTENSGRYGGVFSSGNPDDVVTCRIEGSLFANNSATEGGVGFGGEWVVTDSTFEGNSARVGGVARGGLWEIASSRFSENFAESSGGVASLVDQHEWTVTECLFEGNRADVSGGVIRGGEWMVFNSVFAENDADSGGVGSWVSFVATNSVFYGNSARMGAVGDVGSWEVINCTFYGNLAEEIGDTGYDGQWVAFNSVFADADPFFSWDRSVMPGR